MRGFCCKLFNILIFAFYIWLNRAVLYIEEPPIFCFSAAFFCILCRRQKRTELPRIHIFSRLPILYTCLLVISSMIFVIAATVILIRAGKNHFAKKRSSIKKIVALGTVISLL